MPSKIVLITWDEPEDKNWLAEDNIAVALNAYCQNTKFRVYPENAIADLMEPKDVDDAIYLAQVWQSVREKGYDSVIDVEKYGIDLVASRILSRKQEQVMPDNNPITRDWSGDEEDNAWKSLQKK